MQALLKQIITNRGETFRKSTALSGGSINAAFQVDTEKSNYFIKVNQNVPSDFFAAEAQGLKKIGRVVNSPKVIEVGKHYLVLAFHDLKPLNEKFGSIAGRELAKLHLCEGKTFGAKENNYIGTLKQQNIACANWADFYWENRISPLVKACFDKNLLDKTDEALFNAFNNLLPQLMPDEKTSLLHGDLWSGNIGWCEDQVLFYDPAVYYGHREIDLAMTKLFGGFPESFYEGYHSVFPLQKGWEQRIPIFQLYPLLVHLYLFGSVYYRQVKRVVLAYS